MITQSELKAYLHYDPDTGEFTHSRLRRKLGTANQHGYLGITIDKTWYAAHRLAFLYMTGEFPEATDHLNGIRTDNRWANLAPAPQSQNMKNKATYRNNSSGHRGVYRRGSGWRAVIACSGKEISLGQFESFEAACAARQQHEQILGFHPNHGRAG